VRRLFGGTKADPRPRVYWDSDVTLTLGSLVNETETKASGKVPVISLAAFREAIGDLWERYRDKAIMIAETSIARRIGKGNTYIAVDEDSWLLLFSRSDEAQAQERADAIASVIGKKLMGARFSLEEIPLPAAQKLGLADILNADGTVNLDAMRGEIAKIKAAQRAYAKPAAPSHARKLADDKAPAKQRIVARARPLPAPPVPPEELSKFHGLVQRYRPAWNAESQSVNTVLFRAYTPEGLSVTDDETAQLNSATALDVVRAGLAAFTEMRKAEVPILFCLPLPVGAFSAQALGEARELIAQIPREARLGDLRLDLRRLPRANPEKLVALRELFRSYARGVTMPINPFTGIEAMLAIDRVAYVADVTRESGATDTEMFEVLLQLKNRAGARAVAVTGLRKRGHLAKAVGAGVAEVSGPALLEETKHPPDRVHRLPRESLMTAI
ncbi:MAG: hypothetical protein K1X51_16520, partial [Rhodospirillaceae bacterium]|nr:hypothetical protein [Rhodospirillaceae bacterium]